MSFCQIAVCLLFSLILGACAGKHTPAAQAVFQIESQSSGLVLIPPSLPGGMPAKAVLFSQIIPDRYGFNPWEQCVNLSHGMRLAVQHMTVYKVEGAKDRMETTDYWYGIVNAGHRRMRLLRSTPGVASLAKPATHLRLFYQTKFTKASGQPVRPALVMWSNSVEHLDTRTAEAHENPAFPCGGGHEDCASFPDRTTVTPEVQIVVNRKPRYVTLGWTVRDVLHADRASNDADIRVLRTYRNGMAPVIWRQKSDVMALPLLGNDEVSW